MQDLHAKAGIIGTGFAYSFPMIENRFNLDEILDLISDIEKTLGIRKPKLDFNLNDNRYWLIAMIDARLKNILDHLRLASKKTCS